jgi:hypothetical protein
VAGAEEDFGGTVPEGNDLVGQRADGQGESAGKAKVSELERAGLVNKEVLGLEVPA